MSFFSFQPRFFLISRCFGGCGQEKVVGWEKQWVRTWLHPLSEGHGGGLGLTWVGRTELCPRPGMMCFSYLIKQNVECKMQAKKWWKYCGREMEEKMLLKARQVFTIKKIFARETAEIFTFHCSLYIHIYVHGCVCVCQCQIPQPKSGMLTTQLNLWGTLYRPTDPGMTRILQWAYTHAGPWSLIRKLFTICLKTT